MPAIISVFTPLILYVSKSPWNQSHSSCHHKWMWVASNWRYCGTERWRWHGYGNGFEEDTVTVFYRKTESEEYLAEHSLQSIDCLFLWTGVPKTRSSQDSFWAKSGFLFPFRKFWPFSYLLTNSQIIYPAIARVWQKWCQPRRITTRNFFANKFFQDSVQIRFG